MSDSSDNKRIAVIGLGNTLRRDDGAGIHILARLEERLKDVQQVSFLNFGISSFGLVNKISDFDEVVLVDAIDAGLSPADFRIFGLEDVALQVRDKKLSSHELSLGDLLQLYQALGLSTRVHVAGIQVKDTSYGLDMTAPLQEAVPRVADQVAAFVKTLPQTPSASAGDHGL